MRFKDKVALVTGSSRGIGKATAIAFAKEGAKVVINYVSDEKNAKNTLDQIHKLGSEAIVVECDVSDENQVKSMVDQTVKKFGKIDILVNNAGIVFDVPFEKSTVDNWRRTLEVNLIGTYLTSKAVAPHMTSGGSIISVSSSNGIDSFSPDCMDYDASKAGIIIFTRDLAKQLAPKIRVNSVAPGWADTDINKDLPKEFVEEEKEKIYLKRWAQPEEIAKAILFLASDDASFITGTTLKVDGGYG